MKRKALILLACAAAGPLLAIGVQKARFYWRVTHIVYRHGTPEMFNRYPQVYGAAPSTLPVAVDHAPGDLPAPRG